MFSSVERLRLIQNEEPGEGEVDRGLDPLEGSVAARGLLGHRLPAVGGRAPGFWRPGLTGLIRITTPPAGYMQH
jgi:hypothetical protein